MSIFEKYQTTPVLPPGAGAKMPSFTQVPQHIAIIMDGNGRWANERGLPRSEGHKMGELALMDTIAGAVQANVKYLTVYAFSTENWKRSPAEVRFLMGYSRDVIHRRTDELHRWGVQMRWIGRHRRLWNSVIKELDKAAEITKNNTGTVFTMCVNYGGQAEIADAVAKIAARVEKGELRADRVGIETVSRHLYDPSIPPVDLLIRSSGEQRLSNYLLWQCAYAEFSFTEIAWPDFNREVLWQEIIKYGTRDRRFGGAVERISSPK